MLPSAPSDPALLAEWNKSRNEAAFRALVARYAGLVHAAARRICGDDAAAGEAAQLTFITLAQKAKSLTSFPSIGGWLHRTALLHARNLRRKSQREHSKLQAFQSAMENPHEAHEDVWKDLRFVLDESLAALSDKDREALLLRFYRALSVKEVASILGIATDAAQKRIDRATARLRDKLARRGCQFGGTLSGVMLTGFAADAQAAAATVSMLASKAITANAAGAVSSTAIFTTAAMKTTTTTFVPLVVLLAAGVWLAGQFRSIAELEDQNARLQKTFADAQSPTAAPGRPVAIKTALDKKPVDWAEVARLLKVAQFEPYALLKSTARMEVQFSAMSRDELLAALDEIAAATIPEDDREVLEKHLFNELIGPKGSPQLGLDRFARRCKEGSWAWTLAAVFKGWIDNEPDQAIAWLRQHAGEMGNPDQLVSQSFFPRLITDPATASRILTALPEDKRLESLRTLEAGDLADAKMQVAWARIFRTDLPAKDRLRAVVWPTGNWSDGDGSRMSMIEVGAYLDRIHATPEESEACVLNTAEELFHAGTFDRNDSRSGAEKIDALRAWVAARAPGLVDRATGKGLVGQCGDFTYADAAGLALRFHEASHNDDLLIPLLEHNSAEDQRATARAMAERLSNESLRSKFLTELQ